MQLADGDDDGFPEPVYGKATFDDAQALDRSSMEDGCDSHGTGGKWDECSNERIGREAQNSQGSVRPQLSWCSLRSVALNSSTRVHVFSAT